MNAKIIKLDINKKLYQRIAAKQRDVKSRYLFFHLLDGAIPFNLTGKSVRVYAVKPDGTEIFNDLQIVDAVKGICKLELTTQMLAIDGIVIMEIMVTEGLSKLTSNIFELEVGKSINSETAIVSTNEFTALVNGLASLSEYDSYKNELKLSRGSAVSVPARLAGIDSTLAEIVQEVNKFEVKRGYGVHIGDSTSAGTPEFQRDTCTWLGFKLGKKVINKGIWGNQLNQVLARLDTDVIPYKPKFCSILCGTNDINNSRSDDDIRNDINSISEKLIANNIKPIWLTIAPRKDKPELLRRIIAHNYWLESYCNVNEILFCDIYSALCSGEGYDLNVPAGRLLEDKLHLTADGHRIVANSLYNIITTEISDKIPSICNGDVSVIIPNIKMYNYSSGTGLADGWNKASGTASEVVYSFEDITYEKDPNARRWQVMTLPTQPTDKVAGLYQRFGASMGMGKTYRISFDLDFKANAQCTCSVYIQSCDNSGMSVGNPSKALFGAEITNVKERISLIHTVPSGATLHDFIISFGGKQFIAKVTNFNCHEVVKVVE